MKAILNVLKIKIARRTSEDEAVSMLSRFIKELTPKYNFLKYVTINEKIYSEIEPINVDPKLPYINDEEMFSALHELVRKSVLELKEKADFFFIREFQNAFEDIESVHRVAMDDMPLNEMQHDYLVNRTHTLSLEKNQLFINVIYALLSVVNSYLSEKESVQFMEKGLLELLLRFPFFHSVNIIKNPESKGYYTVEITESIEKYPTYQFADSIYQLILYIGTNLNIDNTEHFRQHFVQKLGIRNTDLLRKINVPIDNIYIPSSSLSKKDISHKLFDSLILIIGNRTSQRFALAVITQIKKSIEQKYTTLQTIQFQKENKSYIIQINDTIDSVDDETFRKAMKTLIEGVGAHLGKKRGDFIDELKKRLGKEYVTSMEKLGLNFHILGMKYN